MESRWRKAKMSLGLNLCVYVPRTLEGDDASSPNTASSTAALVSPVASSSSAATSTNTTPTAASAEQSNGKPNSGAGALMPTTPTPTSAGLRLSKSGSKSFKHRDSTDSREPTTGSLWGALLTESQKEPVYEPAVTTNQPQPQ